MYCDFHKAFDTVPHRRLSAKPMANGIKGDTLKWVESFLSDHSQRVNLNGIKSAPIKVTSGIPQGSVLGPLLYVVYINDLPDQVSKDSKVYLFADDTKVYRRIKEASDCQELQKDLNNMQH